MLCGLAVTPVVKGIVIPMEIGSVSLGEEQAVRCHQKPQPGLRPGALCWDGGSRCSLSSGPRLGVVGWRRAAGKGPAQALGGAGDDAWWVRGGGRGLPLLVASGKGQGEPSKISSTSKW